MRIKSIKPTDRYEPVEMKHLVGRDNLAVLGPTTNKCGQDAPETEFKKVRNFGKIKTGPTIIIKHDGGQLQCDPEHRVLTTSGEKFVKDLQPGNDSLCGMRGVITEYNKTDGPVADLYDLEIDSPHLYFTSEIVSHNSIWLCNNSANSVALGLDTLHITCEMSAARTARRILGAMTQKRIKTLHEHREAVCDQVGRLYNTHKAKLGIFEFNPEEISVDHIRSLITTLKRTKSWTPKVIVIDYLELLMSRRSDFNKEDYDRQKHVAIEVCGLAKSEQALVYSATQTNRSGSGQASKFGADKQVHIDLSQAAESYGKMMPVDYVVSLNQTKEQRTAELPVVDMFIAKNREGPKSITIQCNINYETMKVMENLI